MKKITLPKASQLTSPNLVTLVCTLKPNGSTNLATVSWCTYLSYRPGMVAFAMAKTSYSGELVRLNKQVIVTVPGVALADAVLGCGSTSGRDTDKVSAFNLKLTALEGSAIKIPEHSRVAMVCTLKEYHEVGDHILYICNVAQVYGDESEAALFAWNGYAQVHGL